MPDEHVKEGVLAGSGTAVAEHLIPLWGALLVSIEH